MDLVACNGLCALLYLRLVRNDVHMSSELPLPSYRCDGDPDVQQEACLGIKDTHVHLDGGRSAPAAYRLSDDNEIRSV